MRKGMKKTRVPFFRPLFRKKGTRVFFKRRAQGESIPRALFVRYFAV
jgi:hypothetical protein